MVGLRLDFTPVQPSQLRHSFTPRSPASPLESIAKRIRCTKSTSDSDSSSDSGSSVKSWSSGPPPSPYKWMWYCHQCRTGYELGVTRRCLIDDHQLCYGQPIKKRSKKGNKKNRACQSEFDYLGWQNHGAWKRTQLGQRSQEEVQMERNCAVQCDWPSQCRWTRKKEQPASDNNASVKETAPQTQEVPAAVDTSEGATQTQKSTGSPVSILRTAAQKITSQWASLLSPIEEEPTSGSIEDFLDLAQARANPTTAPKRFDTSCQVSSTLENIPFIPPLQISKDTGSISSALPKADTEISILEFDFDFGLNRNVEEEEEDATSPPPFSKGLHDLVAGTVGIALSISSPASLEHENGNSGSRCVSAPPCLGPGLQEQLLVERRMSARSI